MINLSNNSSPTQLAKIRLQPRIICFSANFLSRANDFNDFIKSRPPRKPVKYNVNAMGVEAASKGSIIPYSIGKRKKQRMKESQQLARNSAKRQISHTLNILGHIKYVLYITFMHKMKMWR